MTGGGGGWSDRWRVRVTGAAGTIYAGERFTLQVRAWARK
jgi:hypothetical protein